MRSRRLSGAAAGYLWGFRPRDLRRIYWYIDGAVRASAALVAAAR